METFLLTEIQIVVLLLVVSLVAVAVRRIRLPYTVALVLAGLALAFQDQLRIELTPELVLALFLPPLVFEAAFHIQFKDLQRDLVPILTQAVPGVLLSTGLVGGILYFTHILPLNTALLFGALISATDPVAVVATFRAVGAPRRLTTLMEGESLFNDGTAIVVFNLVLAWVVGEEISAADGVLDFFLVSLGGLGVGAVLGYLASQFIARIDDYLIEITITTILAYAAFLIGEELLHVSGVLAVVAAGIINGNIGPRGMSPTTRIVLYNFWEYLAFIANSFIFLLIGMNVNFDELTRYAVPALVAAVGVLVARGITVYFLGGLLRLFKKGIPTSYLHVTIWGGLRGAVSLALVLSLPTGLADRRQLLAMTFGVVLFTLLAQATTISGLLNRLGLVVGHPLSKAYKRLQGQLLAIRAAKRHLQRLYNDGALIPQAWNTVRGELDEHEESVSTAMDSLLADDPSLQEQVVGLARMESLRAQRAALSSLERDGLIGEEIVLELQAEVDMALDEASHQSHA